MREACGIFGIITKNKNVSEFIYLGLHALQHRGQESAGMAVSNGKNIQVYKQMGLVSQVFNWELLAGLKGSLGIGHNRYGTCGSSNIENAQPIILNTNAGKFALAHNGNLVNYQSLRKELLNSGQSFTSTSDSEIIAKLIAQVPVKRWQTKIVKGIESLKGAYSLVILTKNKLFGVRDPLGIRPLVLGKINGGYLLASESSAIVNVGGKVIRELYPGEVLIIDNHGYKTHKRIKSKKTAFCIFEYIYFSRPDSFLNGKLVYQTRLNAGRILAEKYPVFADYVISIPDSGTSGAIGYSQASGIQFIEGLLKSRYVGRTFIQPETKIRKLGIKLKFNPVGGLLKGKSIVVVDDSIVRGTTIRDLTKLLKNNGVKAVHVRIASPPLISPCYLGVDINRYSELIAYNRSIEQIRKKIGADSLGYLTLNDLKKAIGKTKIDFCTGCFTGEYPIAIEALKKSQKKITTEKKIAVLISNKGTGSNLQALINAVNKKQIKGRIVCVISDKADAYGLKRVKKEKIPVEIVPLSDYRDQKVRKKYGQKLAKMLKEKYNPDLIVLAGWMLILPKEFLDEFPFKVINLHPGLLPDGQGGDFISSDGRVAKGHKGKMADGAIESAFESGLGFSGSSVHFVTEKVDWGPVVLRAEEKIKESDSIDSYYARLKKKEHHILTSAAKLFCENKLKVENGLVNILDKKISQRQKFDFIGFGALNIDNFFRKNRNKLNKIVGRAGGGAAANSVSALSKLGFNCGLVGILGQDENGQYFRKDLDRFGIDTSMISQKSSELTGIANVFIPKSGHRRIKYQTGVNQKIEYKDINQKYLTSADFLLLSGFVDEKQLAAQIKLLESLKGKVAIALLLSENYLSFGYKRVRKLLKNTDYLFAKKNDIAALTGLNYEEAVDKFLKEGSQTVSIIKSPRESYSGSGEEKFHLQNNKFKIIDNTGYSCAYTAGFLFGLKKRYSFKQCARLGSALMRFCSSKVGARTNLPDRHELLASTGSRKKRKKILIVGGGGREYTLAWKLAREKEVASIYTAPGNAGTAQFGVNVNIDPLDVKGLAEFAKKKQIDLTIVGPEAPLADGIVDHFTEKDLSVFGPSQKAAQIESSKIFAKRFMKKYGIPTADFRVFYSYQKAIGWVNKVKFPIVIKADGLCGGKGVFVCHKKSEAKKALEKLMIKKVFGSAGSKVLIEECLSGPEASVLAFTDGKTIVPMVPARDHKPVFDKNKGPNTGGMGCFAPTEIVTPQMMRKITGQILLPTIKNLQKIGRPYKGVLYAGLMITKKGPMVLEFNCRFGDPETQVIIPLLKGSLSKILFSCADGTLKKNQVRWKNKKSVCVVLTSGGYPDSFKKNYFIKGIDKKPSGEEILTIHAGTVFKVVTASGRVLGIAGLDSTIDKARKKVYKEISKLNFKNMHFRKDIGLK